MTKRQLIFAVALCQLSVGLSVAHDLSAIGGAQPTWFGVSQAALPQTKASAKDLSASCVNGAQIATSFAPFKPKVRFYWDDAYFYEESDNLPDRTMMPNLMVGITSWQQQIPVPAAYFASTLNPENNSGSLGYRQPNYWRLPLVPIPAASPIRIFTVGSTSNNFQRGAIALAANGVAIFNPANNTGRVSYEIGELDSYGGHCGLADDYHYHIIPTHLLSAFGGVLGNDRPVAWALDGYPIYGYLEPDGTPRQPITVDGGHDLGNSWGFHYHAIGTTNTDATHPFGTPQSPYLMTNFHGTVVNFGGQVDGQPEVGSIRQSGTGGYTAQPVNGASIIAFKNPVALGTNAGHFFENTNGVLSTDQFLMRVAIGGTNYDECWQINRLVTPKSLTVTWRLPGATTTTTYTPTAGTASGNRLTAYPMAASSMAKLPDTSQVLDTTATFGEDADYAINAQSFTDNGNGTITDNMTGLMWQKVDNGESTWDYAVTNAASVSTGGYTDWRLPTPSELFSIFNHNNGNPVALNTTYFPTNSAGAAEYWWTSDAYGASATSVWCANAGGGLGGKPKSETLSAGGSFRYHARYVRGAKANNGHNYLRNCDGTVTDLDTGLMWTEVPGAATTWDAALTYAEGLALGGYTDWRLPNVKELQTLTDYTLTTATSTNGIRPSLNRTLFAQTLTGCATTSGGTTITCDSTTGLITGMPLVDVVDISGTYLPTNGPTVVSVINATTFTVSSSAGIATGSNLTLKALAPPTAYWSSTSLRGDTTKAWLVEHGINNSVAATNGPTRNSQGIISYESKTSSYPVFTVRTAAVTGTNTPPTLAALANRIGIPGQTLLITNVASDAETPGLLTFSLTSTPAIGATINPITGLITWVTTTNNANTTNQFTVVVADNGTPNLTATQSCTVTVVGTRSISQGRATTITTNLYPGGQRVSGVGGITALDGTVWTVPSATPFASSPKAPDLYNETVGITPTNILAANTNVPVAVVDADGEVITGYIFCDNYFELYVNGVLVGVDPVPYTPFNSCIVKFRARRPITYAVRLVDWEENLGLGTELNGGNPNHAGDGGFIASFSDGTVTGPNWKAQSFYIAPLDNPALVVEMPDGTHDSSAASTTTTLGTNAYALHYLVPPDWYSKSFNASNWPAATTYTEAQVGVNNLYAYLNFPGQFSASGAQFIWSSSLVLDNEVIVRFTGSAPAAQIAVEQPAGTPLTDGTSTVSYGSVNVGSTSSKTFTIRNSGTNTLTLTGTTIDGANATNFLVTAPPAGSSIASGSNTTMTVQFNATSAGTRVATLHIASSDTSVGAAFDIGLQGVGVIPPPAITNTATSPNTPTYVDGVFVTARIQPASGATITQVQLTYSAGGLTTNTVFTETMAAAAATPWTGTNANNLWTVTTLGPGNTFKQTTAANHGTGNPCGLEFDKGTVNLTDSMLTTANAINAAGSAGYVEFWVLTLNMISPNGWAFQLSTDNGTNWTTRLSELTGLNHVYQLYHYDLLPSERVSTLKMRFQFAGYNAVAPTPAPKANLDDIKVVTTTGSPPLTIPMYDDGLHGDNRAGDGNYGALIPVAAAGTVVTYTITATDSNGGVTTSVTAGTYTVSAVTPTNLLANVALSGSNAVLRWNSQAGLSYSVLSSDDLVTWNNLFVGQTNTWTDLGDLSSTPRRFYRVMR